MRERIVERLNYLKSSIYFILIVIYKIQLGIASTPELQDQQVEMHPTATKETITAPAEKLLKKKQIRDTKILNTIVTELKRYKERYDNKGNYPQSEWKYVFREFVKLLTTDSFIAQYDTEISVVSLDPEITNITITLKKEANRDGLYITAEINKEFFYLVIHEEEIIEGVSSYESSWYNSPHSRFPQ